MIGKEQKADIGKATQFQPGQSGNVAGKPKGTKHLSTWIQQLLNDEKFETQVRDGLKIVDYKGAPIQAIVTAQMIKAVNGDVKAFDVLAKYGWGTKMEIEHSGEVSTGLADSKLADEFGEFLKTKTKE